MCLRVAIPAKTQPVLFPEGVISVLPMGLEPISLAAEVFKTSVYAIPPRERGTSVESRTRST